MKHPILLGILLSLPLSLFAQQTPDSVVATINDVDISEIEVRHFISRQTKPVKRETAIQEMINVELLTQAAKTEGFTSKPFLKLELKRTENALIASLYLQQVLKDMKISDEILQERYQQEVLTTNKGVAEFNANHILVKTEQEALEIITRLDKGEAFTDLAKSLSTGPSGKNGGELGWFKPADMVPPFSKAAQELKPGAYTQKPVKTQFGWHVILLNDQREGSAPTFKSMKKDLRTLVVAEGIRKKINDLRSAAKVDIKTKK